MEHVRVYGSVPKESVVVTPGVKVDMTRSQKMTCQKAKTPHDRPAVTPINAKLRASTGS